MNSKSSWAAKRARNKYEQLVDRFFREHGRLGNPEERSNCLRDHTYFINLMESTRKIYYSDPVDSPQLPQL